MKLVPERTGYAAPFLPTLHALLLAFPIALFASALASDVTYLNTAVVQWSHFAAWLVTGGVAFGTVVLAWAAIAFFARRATPWRLRALLYLVAVAVMWLAGLVNAFQHSRDAWSSVGTAGLALSSIATLAALGAGWIGYSGTRLREAAR